MQNLRRIMSKRIASIHLAEISPLESVVANCKMGTEQVKAKTGTDNILNGGGGAPL